MTKPPYDPDKLPLDLQAMIPNYPRRPTFNPSHSASASLQNNRPTPLKTFVVTPRYDKEMVTPKSYAQVAIMVSPPRSCELKPIQKFGHQLASSEKEKCHCDYYKQIVNKKF